ncbi:MAG TPA: hypothetical protein VM324_09070 [Egibacteraceae bacterium]|nr:hypothetical protein [Egibacteraceae bacterium]
MTRDRSPPPRDHPDRSALGADLTNRLRRITAAALLAATLVLVVAVAVGRLT